MNTATRQFICYAIENTSLTFDEISERTGVSVKNIVKTYNEEMTAVRGVSRAE